MGLVKNNLFVCLLFILISQKNLSAQLDGSISEKIKIELDSQTINKILKIDSTFLNINQKVNLYKIKYYSDSIEIDGFLAEPKENGKYPCIISNRGGNRDFGKWSPYTIGLSLISMASWGYIVVASQYRKNDEFGGKDLNDVMNLIPLLANLSNADTSKIGIEGSSRGGMMTYLALKKSCKFKSAVITAGITNLYLTLKNRPEFDSSVFSQIIPNYQNDKDFQLKNRSVVYWSDSLCNNTNILIMHGTADKNISVDESLELLSLIKKTNKVRFIMFENSDHFISNFYFDRLQNIKRHFDLYLK